ncbi:TKL protein kinase [Saprolegnia parasitica CBS 223.65]|uniref:TKL protein kinase n=1 Tax=Saprolegnia parasitica (strain CBS 223.65) TaxID=695850 RepID=A0A067CNQ1_SAPPC|nr:TKL protein kinase [Saprolegnia parasitica CBS 223.65]KDO28447.1 TKL protein kinase [Saprolegnia parasitica CBS 223.65]|eukprot:XP_012200887.1 TKL protein kinase [Saprolegnia parasitica CBS 223.65]
MDTSLMCEVCNVPNDIRAPCCKRCKQPVRSDSEKLLILLKRFDRFSTLQSSEPPAKIEAELDATKASLSSLAAERDQLQRENYELTRRLQQLSSFDKEPEYEDKIHALESQLQELQSSQQSFAANLHMLTFIPAAHFKLQRSIPTSSSSVFQLDVGTIDGKPVVRKQLFRTDASDAAVVTFKESIALLAKLGGADGTAVSLLGTSGLSQGHTQVYLEYLELGDLHSVLRAGPSLTWATRLRIALHVARALSQLHALDLVHKRIHSSHVLLGAGYVAKLSGWTQARATARLDEQADMRWAAPELFADRALPTSTADIYSLGLLLVELDTAEAPYAHVRDRRGKPVGDLTLIDLLRRATPTDLVLQHAFRDSPDWYRALATRCTDLDPRRRPSSVEVVRHLEARLFPQVHTTSGLPPLVLRVTVLSASSLLHVADMGDMPSFVSLHLHDATATTQASVDYTWDETFEFSALHLMESTLEAQIRYGRSGQIGVVHLALAKVMDELDELQAWTRWLPVQSRGDPHGYLVLKLEIKGDVEAWMGAYVQSLPRLQDTKEPLMQAKISRATTVFQTLKARRSIVRQGGSRLRP